MPSDLVPLCCSYISFFLYSSFKEANVTFLFLLVGEEAAMVQDVERAAMVEDVKRAAMVEDVEGATLVENVEGQSRLGGGCI